MRLYTETNKNGIISAKFVYSRNTIIKNFRICFSLLSKCSPVSGCKLKKQVGGYSELEPNPKRSLTKGQKWEFSFKYELERHAPVNISWGPMGTFLKIKNGKTFDIETKPLKFSNVPTRNRNIINSKEPEIRLIPNPVSWQKSRGKCRLTIGINLTNSHNNNVKKAIDSFNSLKERLGFEWSENVAGINVIFENSAQNLNSEGYEMLIESKLIKIISLNSIGFLYGLISLLQLRETYNDVIPCGKILDYPRFSWRGQHLDCARHYYEVDSILKLLDIMSLLKLNRFHWHLIDDESFRIELDCLPHLASNSGYRGDQCIIPGVFGGGSGPTGGTYNKNDIELILERASELGISVIPEIEIPAHSLAVTKLIPNVRDPEDKSFEESVQGYLENTLNPAMPATWKYLEEIIHEIIKIFPFRLIHLGCDEIPQKIWEKSPAIKKLKKNNDLKSTEDVLEWMMKKVAKIVKKAGGRSAAWEVAARGKKGGIGQGALIFSWSEKEPGLRAAREGYDVVMCPAKHVYFDMAHTSHPHEVGLSWAAFVSMKDALDWEPIPTNEPELEKKIVGMQGQLWSETIIKDRDMEKMIAPRILALSEGAWSTSFRKRKLNEFLGVSKYYLRIFEKINWESHELV